ncbi:hypothetical protein DPMN_164152 [Dreissena polymorpha]|uniref:Uncharacterized protein n=1 Tax=Dreissena polymorpha TaxID=45954 RepID=A0A9D4IS32_DREPO|nr:hypothetical protein DPMN_164152 [Dreissena polymorpha]
MLAHHISNRQKPTVVNRQDGRQTYQPIRRPISLHFNQSEGLNRNKPSKMATKIPFSPYFYAKMKINVPILKIQMTAFQWFQIKIKDQTKQ